MSASLENPALYLWLSQIGPTGVDRRLVRHDPASRSRYVISFLTRWFTFFRGHPLCALVLGRAMTSGPLILGCMASRPRTVWGCQIGTLGGRRSLVAYSLRQLTAIFQHGVTKRIEVSHDLVTFKLCAAVINRPLRPSSVKVAKTPLACAWFPHAFVQPQI